MTGIIHAVVRSDGRQATAVSVLSSRNGGECATLEMGIHVSDSMFVASIQCWWLLNVNKLMVRYSQPISL